MERRLGRRIPETIKPRGRTASSGTGLETGDQTLCTLTTKPSKRLNSRRSRSGEWQQSPSTYT